MAILLRISGVAIIADTYSSVHLYMAAAIKATRIESTRINAFLIEASLVV